MKVHETIGPGDDMNLVLTMAGKYSRFKLFGSKVPKYLLPLGAETVLAKIIKEYTRLFQVEKIYLIANKNDQIFFPIVRSTLKKFDIPTSNIMYIDDTASQLESALTACEMIPVELQRMQIAFANIDTVLRNREVFIDKLKSCTNEMACIDTFPGSSVQYSYANINEIGLIEDIEDQKIIGENACSGLYGFGSFEYMNQIATEVLKQENNASFTRLYQEYLNRKNKILASNVESTNDTIVLGTPEEYIINIHRFS